MQKLKHCEAQNIRSSYRVSYIAATTLLHMLCREGRVAEVS